MKLAIHKSNWGFSPDWISYCKINDIPFKVVNCYDSDIIEQIADCDALMWHHHHILIPDKLFAKQLLNAIEQSGKRVFPDFFTSWHFDDKVGQKYLLEALNAPLVPTHVFYKKQEALSWVETVNFPKVFKLRGGAGSSNVKLVRSKKMARSLIKTAFGRGFPSYDKIEDLKENLRKFLIKKTNFRNVAKSFRRLLMSTVYGRTMGREKGYVLFQEFVPNNNFDIRVIVIDDKAFAIKRYVRKNDFRASGSGFVSYEKSEFDLNCIRLAFEIKTKLNAQCVAFDFVFDENNTPLIVEINYGFAKEVYYPCPGYWDENLNWFEGRFNPAYWMVDLLLKRSIKP